MCRRRRCLGEKCKTADFAPSKPLHRTSLTRQRRINQPSLARQACAIFCFIVFAGFAAAFIQFPKDPFRINE
jgi:hypothetical protein